MNKGYKIVSLSKQGVKKNFRVHRLVAEAFIDNPLNLPQVNHIDENRTNNVVDNLEWCDNKYNSNYGSHNQKISISRGKAVLCVETGIIYHSAREASRQITGRDGCFIADVCRGDRPTAYGYHWKYI